MGHDYQFKNDLSGCHPLLLLALAAARAAALFGAARRSLGARLATNQFYQGHLRGVEEDGATVLLEAPNGRMHRLPLRLITRGRLEVEF